MTCTAWHGIVVAAVAWGGLVGFDRVAIGVVAHVVAWLAGGLPDICGHAEALTFRIGIPCAQGVTGHGKPGTVTGATTRGDHGVEVEGGGGHAPASVHCRPDEGYPWS